MMHKDDTTAATTTTTPSPHVTTRDDQCGCHCCPNGLWATLLINMLVWTAVVFSGGAVLDCHLVEADIGDASNAWPALPSNLIGLTDGQASDRRGFGFFIHEDANGDCRWEYWGDQMHSSDSEDWTSADEREFEDYVKDYYEWMGEEWNTAAKVACTAWGFGFALVIAAGLYACMAHVWFIRYLTAAAAILIIMPLQFGALAAVNSDFCKDRDCELARSGHFAIVAGLLYLVAGVIFFFMHNFPGKQTPLVLPAAAPEQKNHAKSLTLQEATYPELDVVDMRDDNVDVPESQRGGIEEAREIKPQIY